MTGAARARPAAIARRHGPALLAYLGLALLAVTPAWFAPGPWMPGHPDSDLSSHLWGWGWFLDTLARGRLPLVVDTALYPDGGPFYLADPLHALLFAPLRPLLGPAGATTAIVLLDLVAASVAAYAVGLVWIGDRAGAFLAGVVFGISSFALSCIHSGTLEYLQLAGLPLFLLAFERALLDGGWRRIGLAIAAWAFVFVCAMYYGIFAALLAAVLTGVRLWRGEVGVETGLRRAAAMVGGTALAVAPLAAAVLWTLSAPGTLMGWDNAAGWDQSRTPVVDLLTLFAPFDYHFPDMEAGGVRGILHANSLGWIAMALAAIGVWRVPAARRWAPVFALYGVLMLGPQLTVAGRPLAIGEIPLLLPLGWLLFPGSPLAVIHHPHRLVAVGMLLLGLLSGFGLSHLLRELAGRRRLAIAAAVGAAVVAEVLWLSPAQWPLPVTPLQPPPIVHELADDPREGAVFDLPPDVTSGTPQYLIWAAVHGRPVPYWIDFYVGDSLAGNDLVRAAEDCLAAPQARRTTREGRILDGLPAPRRAGLDDGARALEAAGFRWILLHRDRTEGDEYDCYRTLLDGVLGAPRATPGAVDVYELPGTPAEGTPR